MKYFLILGALVIIVALAICFSGETKIITNKQAIEIAEKHYVHGDKKPLRVEGYREGDIMTVTYIFRERTIDDPYGDYIFYFVNAKTGKYIDYMEPKSSDFIAQKKKLPQPKVGSKGYITDEQAIQIVKRIDAYGSPNKRIVVERKGEIITVTFPSDLSPEVKPGGDFVRRFTIDVKTGKVICMEISN